MVDEGVGYGGVRPVDSSHRCLLWAESNRFIQRSLTLFLSTVVLDVLSIHIFTRRHVRRNRQVRWRHCVPEKERGSGCGVALVLPQ